MESLIPLLAVLACPVGMGLMMWMITRGNAQAAAPSPLESSERVAVSELNVERRPTAPAPTAQLGPSAQGGIAKMCGMCLNWRVVGALAAVGLGIWVVAPGVLGAALPLLLLAACPISMLLMMRRGQGAQCAPSEGQMNQSASTEVAREERLAELRARMGDVEAQQQAIARQIAQLEGASAEAISEAEAVAHAVAERARGSS